MKNLLIYNDCLKILLQASMQECNLLHIHCQTRSKTKREQQESSLTLNLTFLHLLFPWWFPKSSSVVEDNIGLVHTSWWK